MEHRYLKMWSYLIFSNILTTSGLLKKIKEVLIINNNFIKFKSFFLLKIQQLNYKQIDALYYFNNLTKFENINLIRNSFYFNKQKSRTIKIISIDILIKLLIIKFIYYIL